MFSITNHISKGKLKDFCHKNQLKRLSLFSSALRDEIREDNDIDILVEFEEGHAPDLLKLSEIEIELTAMIRRKVDLRTPAELSRFFREVEYAA